MAMSKAVQSVAMLLLTVMMLPAAGLSAVAESPAGVEQRRNADYGTVSLDGNPLFVMKENLSVYSPTERAQIVNSRLATISNRFIESIPLSVDCSTNGCR